MDTFRRKTMFSSRLNSNVPSVLLGHPQFLFALSPTPTYPPAFNSSVRKRDICLIEKDDRGEFSGHSAWTPSPQHKCPLAVVLDQETFWGPIV